MGYFHKDLTSERWNRFSLFEQMANIGAEIGRTVNWKEKDKKQSQSAFFRALELLDFTISDPKNKNRLKELTRTREALIDHFVYDNIYHSTDDQWNNYFFAFNWAARLGK